MLFNVRQDLQLMGFTARKESQNHFCLSPDQMELPFLSRAMAIFTGYLYSERGSSVNCVAISKQIRFFNVKKVQLKY